MKAAILGTVPVSRVVAPYDDPSWEIWVCSPGNSQQAVPPRVTRWFELHAIVDMLGGENNAWRPAYFEWLNKQTFPIYMQERNSHVPNAIPFPRDVLLQKWGPSKTRTNWFTSSIAWMMAYAMHLGAEEIGVFGVDMAATEEHYSWQKAGCLRFIEICHDMGIKVTVPLESTLTCGAPLYGYAEASRQGRSMIVREHEMRAKLQHTEHEIHRLSHEASFFKGAIEQISFQRRTFISGLDDAEIEVDAAELIVNQVDQPGLLNPNPPGDYSRTAAGVLAPSEALAPPPSRPPSPGDFDNPDAALLERPASKPNGSWSPEVAFERAAAEASAMIDDVAVRPE